MSSPETNEMLFAAEDRFLIIGVKDAPELLPGWRIMEGFDLAMNTVIEAENFNLVIDISGLEIMYNDVIDWFLHAFINSPKLIVLYSTENEKKLLENALGREYYRDIICIKKPIPKVNYIQHDLAIFDDSVAREIAKMELGNLLLAGKYEEWDESIWERADFIRVREILNFIHEYGKNSLLNEFAFTINKDYITVTPYHSHALYRTAAPEVRQSIIARPGVIARKTGSILSKETKEFEIIINKPKVKERELDGFLKQHKHFFRGLNYQNVYPQLVLERRGKRNLIPDFICEPIGSEWCDILDLKIPITKPIDVGGVDRARLAVVIADGVAQLREYAAWFEDEQNFKSFRRKYGLTVYKPKLKLIVGRDPRSHDEKQLRRMMTAYADIDILTYDRFLRICKSRLLI